MDKTKVVYFGTPQLSAEILQRLISSKIVNVKAVITRADKPSGRQQLLSQSAVSKIASSHKIPALKPIKLDQEFISSNQELLQADLYIVAAYGKIIPQSLLDIPKQGTLNVHGSLLPNYRGASPIQQSILNGDKISGVTIMLVDAEMDHGPVILTKEVSLSEKENFKTLSKKISEAGADALIEAIPQFLAKKLKPKEQNHNQATYTKIIKKDDGYFAIQTPPSKEVLDRMIRAYYPWPGVWTRWNNKIIKFYPGNLIQMEGKKAIAVKDFLNGYPDFPLADLLQSPT